MKKTQSRRERYEESAKRTQVLSIRTSKTDDEDEWQAIVEWLKSEGDGKAKDGIYKLAKENNII